MSRSKVTGILLTGVFILFAQTPVYAQDASDPRQWADSLFQTLLKKGEDDFSAQLKNTLMGKETGGAEVIVNAVQKTHTLGGDLTGFEYISQQQLGPRLRRLKYATYNVRYFLVFQLSFYKSDNGWELFGADLNSSSDKIPWE